MVMKSIHTISAPWHPFHWHHWPTRERLSRPTQRADHRLS